MLCSICGFFFFFFFFFYLFHSTQRTSAFIFIFPLSKKKLKKTTINHKKTNKLQQKKHAQQRQDTSVFVEILHGIDNFIENLKIETFAIVYVMFAILTLKVLSSSECYSFNCLSVVGSKSEFRALPPPSTVATFLVLEHITLIHSLGKVRALLCQRTSRRQLDSRFLKLR